MSNITSLETITLSISILSLFFSAWAIHSSWQLKKFRRHLLKNHRYQSEEEILNSFAEQLSVIEKSQIKTIEHIHKIDETLLKTIQNIRIIKYNSMANDGGNFSFSVALLDPTNSGIILTSLYGRNLSRLYIKRISLGKSELPLTEEEKKLILNISPQEQNNYSDYQDNP